MSGIRGGGTPPPPPPGDMPKTPADGETDGVQQQQGEAGRAATESASGKTPSKLTHDSFETGGPRVTRQLETQLQALGGKAQPKIQFTNKDLEALASTFAAILSQYPNETRRKRAKLFTKAILKRRRLRKLFAGASESEMDTMYDVISQQLDGSPVFAELVDEVTEGARKYGAKGA